MKIPVKVISVEITNYEKEDEKFISRDRYLMETNCHYGTFVFIYIYTFVMNIARIVHNTA